MKLRKGLDTVESLSVEVSGFTKTRAFTIKAGQNSPSSVGFTKPRVFAAKSGQNISCSVGVTKSNTSKSLSRPHFCERFLVSWPKFYQK